MPTYKYRHRETYKNVILDIKANSTKELNEKTNRKKAEIDRGISLDVTNDTVKRWSERWLESYVKGKVTDKTYRDIKGRLNNKILPVIGHMKLTDVKPIHCKAVMDGLSGLSKNRIDKTYNTMYQIFRAAQASWLIDRNPAMDVAKPPAKDGQGRPLTPYEREILEKVCQYHPMGDWALMMLFSGARPGETCRMQWCHLKNGGIYIDGTKTKNAKRTVPLPDDYYSRLDGRRGDPFDYIFTRTGSKMIYNATANSWKNIRRSMQIEAGTKVSGRGELLPPFKIDPKLIAYSCRHTFATELKDAMMPFTVMQELMGHSTGAVTDTYLHSTETSFTMAKRLLEAHRSGEKSTKRETKRETL